MPDPIGINDVNRIARRYVMPQLVEDIYNTPDCVKDWKPDLRYKMRRWRERWATRLSNAYRCLREDNPYA